MIVFNESGRGLDAHFHVEGSEGRVEVVVESRGGGRTSSRARNSDYNPGFRLILRRLGEMSALLEDAYVDSSEVQRLPIARRRLELESGYPVVLARVDAEALRLELARLQSQVGRAPGALGSGNRTKRVRLVVRGDERPLDPDEVELRLGGPTADVTAGPPSAGLPDRSTTQGFISDARVSVAIERHAVGHAIRHFETAGWAVDDVGGTESFDLRCTRPGEEMHVEVKGTTSGGEFVLMTRNEILHAWSCAHPALVVVSSISLTTGDSPQAAGGAVHIVDPWSPLAEDLDPISYRVRVAPPSHGGPD